MKRKKLTPEEREWRRREQSAAKKNARKRIELAYKRAEDQKPGQMAVICTEWFQQAFMTADEFYRRFPYKWDAPLDSGFEQQIPMLRPMA